VAEKKKRTRKERLEEINRRAEDRPIVRHLRELYERGMAELEAKRETEQQG
jgi:hypothetical protein